MDTFVLKMRWIAFRMEWSRRVKRFFYCKRGWHKALPNSLSTQFSGKRTRTVRYLHCWPCNTYFFAKKSDLKFYRRSQDRHKTTMDNMLTGLIEKTEGKVKGKLRRARKVVRKTNHKQKQFNKL